jgi:hypothetical protein
MRRLVIVAVAVVVAVVLFVVLRQGDDEGEAQGTSSTTLVTETTLTLTTPAPPPAPPPAARVQITVEGGRPVGGVESVTVARNRRVVLIVTSDVSEEVHLHGYNIARDVGPGQPARIAFRATIVGTVEAELELSGVPLARITTTP